ncbi:MAG: hypothetical protein ACI9SQ_000711, partial [Rubritalea sp.]
MGRFDHKPLIFLMGIFHTPQQNHPPRIMGSNCHQFG